MAEGDTGEVGYNRESITENVFYIMVTNIEEEEEIGEAKDGSYTIDKITISTSYYSWDGTNFKLTKTINKKPILKNLQSQTKNKNMENKTFVGNVVNETVAYKSPWLPSPVS